MFSRFVIILIVNVIVLSPASYAWNPDLLENELDPGVKRIILNNLEVKSLAAFSEAVSLTNRMSASRIKWAKAVMSEIRDRMIGVAARQGLQRQMSIVSQTNPCVHYQEQTIPYGPELSYVLTTVCTYDIHPPRELSPRGIPQTPVLDPLLALGNGIIPLAHRLEDKESLLLGVQAVALILSRIYHLDSYPTSESCSVFPPPPSNYCLELEMNFHDQAKGNEDDGKLRWAKENRFSTKMIFVKPNMFGSLESICLKAGSQFQETAFADHCFSMAAHIRMSKYSPTLTDAEKASEHLLRVNNSALFRKVAPLVFARLSHGPHTNYVPAQTRMVKHVVVTNRLEDEFAYQTYGIIPPDYKAITETWHEKRPIEQVETLKLPPRPEESPEKRESLNPKALALLKHAIENLGLSVEDLSHPSASLNAAVRSYIRDYAESLDETVKNYLTNLIIMDNVSQLPKPPSERDFAG